MTTTNFEDWLNSNEPQDDNEAFDLHRAVTELSSYGAYEISRKKEQVFIKGYDGWLMLASSKALDAFRRRVDDYCPDPELGWEGSEYYLHAMAKDD